MRTPYAQSFLTVYVCVRTPPSNLKQSPICSRYPLSKITKIRGESKKSKKSLINKRFFFYFPSFPFFPLARGSRARRV